MIPHDYWGQIHFLLFLNSSDSVPATLAFHDHQIIHGANNINIFSAETADALSSELKRLDTDDKKTLHFISHGYANGPVGFLSNRKEHQNVKEILDSFKYRNLVTLNFMSTCYQFHIDLNGFRHLFTTGLGASEAVSGLGIAKSIEQIYSHPPENLDTRKIEGARIYKWHY